MSCTGSSAATDDSTQRPNKRNHNRVCYYFKTSQGCKRGDACAFIHQKERIKAEVLLDRHDTQDKEHPNFSAASNFSHDACNRVVVPPNVRQGVIKPSKVVLNSDQAGTESQLAARELDLGFFRRRFPKCVETMCENSTIFTLNYRVTNPDWVFIVRSIVFRVMIKPEHPIQIPVVEIPQIENQALPSILITHLERCINGFIEKNYSSFRASDAYELTGKVLIRWLDSNILTIFVEGLRKTKLVTDAEKSGITLVMPNDQAKNATTENVEFRDKVVGNEQRCNGTAEEEEVVTDELKKLDVHRNDCEGFDMPKKENENLYHSLGVPLIEVVLVWRELSGSRPNIATITAVYLYISSKCLRCQHEHVNKIGADNRLYCWQCSRCCITQSMRLEPQLVHENSTVLALLEVTACRPVDCILRDSLLRFVCLTCQKEEEVQKFNFGSSHKSWCHGCHSLCQFSINAIRFRGDLSKIPNQDHATSCKISKNKKEIKSIVSLVEGQPLPELGTCKHYKKSFRWFRFPCCGKAFPCDICHDERTCGEHEMKVANRMICGHCGTEQPYTVGKPCSNCKRAVTRSRSHFWEGGKGCRDRVMMNRKDNHKFVHSQRGTAQKTATTTKKSKCH